MASEGPSQPAPPAPPEKEMAPYVIEGARSSGRRLTRSLIERAVRENDKQRFSISEDGDRIRANQGHSVDVDLQLPAIKPAPCTATV